MRPFRDRLVVALSVALAVPFSPALAAGKAGFGILNEDVGARSAGMGGVSSAPGDNAAGFFGNPAAAAEARQKEISLAFHDGLGGISRSAAAYVHPLNTGALAAGLRTLGSGNFASYNSSDEKVGVVSAEDTVVTAGYARPLGGRWAMGMGLSQVSETLADRSVKVVSMDGGLSYRPSWGPLRFSGALRHLGGSATFDREGVGLPRSLDLGAAFQGFADALTVALESHQGLGDGNFLRAGAEFWVEPTFCLRAGWTGGRAASRGVTFGAGFRLKFVQWDYAYVSSVDGFDDTHRLGLRFFFGGPAERTLREGMTLLRRGNAAEAILKLEEALDVDPRNRTAARAMREAVKLLDRQMSEERKEAQP